MLPPELQLTQTCQVSLTSSAPAQIQFNLSVSDSTQGTQTVSDLVLLPFTIQSFANGPLGLAYQPLSASGAAGVLSDLSQGFRCFEYRICWRPEADLR